MRVLGIDPGLTRCGWGVVDGRPGARPVAVGVGVVRTAAELDLELRLLELHTAVTALLREHRPDVVAIERVFTQNNKGTATGTAQAAGVAALAAAQADRQVAWHTPSEVKAAISGSGRADKEQVTLMVTRVLGLASPPKPADAADALALAVQCTPGTIARLQVGESARLATSLVVREDSLTLYGFADDDERQLFELLQTANGVGPRLAQAVLAIHPPREVRRAVSMADVKALMQVPGIGKKGAERLILELRDRLGSVTTDTSLDGPATPGLPSVTPVAPWRDQLTSALVSLGWSVKEAEGAVVQLAPVADEQISATGSIEVAVLLRQALQLL